MSLAARKAAARKAAFVRRKMVHAKARSAEGAARLLDHLAPHQGKVIAAYMPIRTEISPLLAMAEMAAFGPICVPVIQGRGQALRFREWAPDCTLVDGPFGAKVPAAGDWLIPEVLIVPLVAFDRSGGRLGYGGGYYDRTLQGLRAAAPVLAVGFAYAAQEAESLPLEPTDQPLDVIVTEREIIVF